MEIPSLSHTRWVCRFSAIQLFLSCFECLNLALETIIVDSTDRAEAVGLSAQLQEFAFLFFLQVFNSVLGLTNPLILYKAAKLSNSY